MTQLRVDGTAVSAGMAWRSRPLHHDDGTTTLSGSVANQAEPHRMLAKIRDLDVVLLSVEPRSLVP